MRHDEPRLAVNLDFSDLKYRFKLKEYILDRNQNLTYRNKVEECIKVMDARIKRHVDTNSQPDYSIKFQAKLEESKLIIIEAFLNQGLELFEVAKTLTIFTKPFVTYYAHLNLAKALIFSTLGFNSERYERHGLEHVSGEAPYKAKSKIFGYYSLFLTSLGNKDLLEKGLSKNGNDPYQFSQLIDPLPQLNGKLKTSDHYSNFLNDIYVISFILGNITRYNPLDWKNKQLGLSRSYILEVNRFYAEVAEFKFKMALLSYFRGEFLHYVRPSYWT